MSDRILEKQTQRQLQPPELLLVTGRVWNFQHNPHVLKVVLAFGRCLWYFAVLWDMGNTFQKH